MFKRFDFGVIPMSASGVRNDRGTTIDPKLSQSGNFIVSRNGKC
jgi:hypothetical protein